GQSGLFDRHVVYSVERFVGTPYPRIAAGNPDMRQHLRRAGVALTMASRDPRPITMANAPDLLTTLYAEVRQLARARLAAGARPTLLDTHALVHESYLRMQRAGQLELGDREHFLAYAAATMRSIVVDFVRRRSAERRGGDVARVTLDTEVAESLGASD